MIPLGTNAKSLTAYAEAFKMVSEELETIATTYNNERHEPEIIAAQVRQRMAVLERKLKVHRLIPDMARLEYELETDRRVWVYVRPEDLFRACAGRLAFFDGLVRPG